MKVKDIMYNNPKVVSPDTILKEVAKIMKENRIGFLPVCDKEKLVGTITDRDIRPLA